MKTIKEQHSFLERLEHLKEAFPNIPEVKYFCCDDTDISKIKTTNNKDISYAKEVLIVGNTLINVTATSVDACLMTILKYTHGLEYSGYMGEVNIEDLEVRKYEN